MVFRIEKNSNYTVMSNYHLKDKRLTLKAKGLLSLMLSLPDDWDYSIKGLVSICQEKETAIETALKELKENGYLKVEKITPDKTESGRIEYEYIIFESPEQGVEKQGVEIQGVENRPQLNTKEPSIKESNKEIYNIYIQVLEYLNHKTGRHYKPTEKAKKLIGARIKEGATLEDFKIVIDKKCADWLQDEKMARYLRPETLFGTKFDGYLNEPEKVQNNPFKAMLRGAV